MPRILVVDHSRFFRARTRALLERDGHEVIEARDLHEAAQRLFVDAPDAVVLDLLHPDRQGLLLLEDLRRRDFAGPVVVVTSDRQSMTRHLALTHGATAILHEPVEALELLSLLETADSVA